ERVVHRPKERVVAATAAGRRIQRRRIGVGYNLEDTSALGLLAVGRRNAQRCANCRSAERKWKDERVASGNPVRPTGGGAGHGPSQSVVGLVGQQSMRSASVENSNRRSDCHANFTVQGSKATALQQS